MAEAPSTQSQASSDQFPTWQKSLSENYVQYMVFLIDTSLAPSQKLAKLNAMRQAIIQLADLLTKDYIWQRDDFRLELKNEKGEGFSLGSTPLQPRRRVANSRSGLAYLHGVTEYGDAVEDEWLIVFILREFTKSDQSAWIRVADDDGEFLLVEAAKVVPKWISPEIDGNRVWINNGQMFIIPVSDTTSSLPANVELAQAVDFITNNKSSLVHSPIIEAEALYRLDKYPDRISSAVHHSLVTIPRKLAHVIHLLPRSIAPAIEAFYFRDPIAMRPFLAAKGHQVFEPHDLVTVSVRFSQILFAQLRSQRLAVPPRWKEVMNKAWGSFNSEGIMEAAYTRLDNGMKLTCGFEMLATKAQDHDRRIVRELGIILEDVEADGDGALPSDADILTWPQVERDDDERWLNINYDDFEKELDGATRATAQKTEATGFGDANVQADLRKIVSRFESFLNDESAGLDGAQLDDMDFDDDSGGDQSNENSGEDDAGDSDYEDRVVSFDEEEFSNMMREMMGLGPDERSGPKSKYAPAAHQTHQLEEDEQEDEQDLHNLTAEMEKELRGHGALRLGTSARDERSLQAKAKGKELEPDTTGAGDSDEEVDIDYNLAKNLLESFKGQGGMSGPTGNLLGLMGFQLPRDEDAFPENEHAGSPRS